VKIHSGTFEVGRIIYINRSKTVIKSVGTGEAGTVLYFSRPLRFLPDPPEPEELS